MTRIDISLMLIRFLVSVVSILNDGVKEVSKHVIALLITSHATDGHDERMTYKKAFLRNKYLDFMVRFILLATFLRVTSSLVHLQGSISKQRKYTADSLAQSGLNLASRLLDLPRHIFYSHFSVAVAE